MSKQSTDLKETKPEGGLDLDNEQIAKFMVITSEFTDLSLERTLAILAAEYHLRGASWDFIKTKIDGLQQIDEYSVKMGFPKTEVDTDRWNVDREKAKIKHNLEHVPDEITELISNIKNIINDPKAIEALREELEGEMDNDPSMMQRFGSILADALRDSGLPIEVEGGIGDHGVVLSINPKEAKEWMGKQHTTRYAGNTKH